MRNQIPIDGAGRVVLPKTIREELHLTAGDLLDVSVENDEIKLRVVRAGNRMVREGQFWVYDAGRPIDPREIDDFVQSLRSSRDAKIAKGSN